MKSPKTKEDLIETVFQQIRQDINSGDYTAIEELLKTISINDLINFLPEQDWEQFENLKNDTN